MRAIEPSASGRLPSRGFEVAWEAFGSDDAPVVLLLPTWQIVHSRVWKMQIPYLARSFRVITWDAPGTGRSERTVDPAAFEYGRIVDQGIDVLDHLGARSASVVGFSRGTDFGVMMAARYPERVERLALIANGVTDAVEVAPSARFHERREQHDGWDKFNAHYWREHYDDWLAFFFSEIFPEPHSTRPIEEACSWGRETSPDTLVQTVANPALLPSMPYREDIERVRCPVLIIHGDQDRIDAIDVSHRLLALRPDWALVTLEGCGHGPLLRDPVRVNLLLGEFLSRGAARAEAGPENSHARA